MILADREFVESDSNQLLNEAANQNIVLLVVGDPFGATTHSDMVLRAKTQGIPFKVVHNSSIMTAVGCCGLQLYSFGETVSIPFWDDSWKPSSFVDKIINNLRNGFHTLCLLDIKVKEQSVEALMKGKKEYDPPRFMSVSVAAKQLIQVIEKLKLEGDTESKQLLNESSPAVGLARIGSDSQEIVYCSLKEMQDVDLGQPLHSLVIPGKMHPLESEMLNLFTKQ